MSEKRKAYAIAGEILSMLEDHFGSFGESSTFRRAYILTDPEIQTIDFYVNFPWGSGCRNTMCSVSWQELMEIPCPVQEWFPKIRDCIASKRDCEVIE